MTTPAARERDGHDRLPAGQPDGQQAGPEGDGQRQREPGPVGRRRAMLIDAGRHGDRVERTERQRPGQRDERQQSQEHEPPADRLADRAGERRADDTGQDPGGRQRGEHARPERFGQRPPDRHVRDRLDRAGAQALDEAGADQHRHRRREATDEQADREQAEPGRERDRQPTAVDRAADDDDADQRAEEERREDPAVQLQPAQPAELVGDDRHDGRDRQRLEADQRDGQDEADGQGAPIGAPQAADRVTPGKSHAPRMARRPLMRHGRPSHAGGRRSIVRARVAATVASACDSRRYWYRGVVTSRHRRFALLDVTFGGVSLPGATVDCWDDSEGHSQWSARIVTRVGPALDEGELTGRTADGRSLSGYAVVADRQVGAGGRRETLVELHGSGDLHGLIEPTA